MSIQYYPNGIGGYPPGDFLDTCKPLQTSGNVWYVSSLIGIDAVSPAGQNREKPLATLAQAVTNALDEDIIVFLPGHIETLTVAQSIAKGVTLLGEGVVDGKPAVTFRINGALSSLFTVTVAGVEFRNLYFPESVQSNTGVRLSVAGTDCVVHGCYFECGANDKGATLSTSLPRTRIENSTFISTAVLRSAQPLMAIRATGAANGLTIRDTVVSAGTVGFSNYSAIDLSGAAIAGLRVESLSLLLGADANYGTAVSGRSNIQLATGGSRVQWS